jgi:isopenicillin-N epimerase
MTPDLARAWDLDPAVDFLNHGSFGACPRAVLARQQTLRAQLEREPVRFMLRELPDLADAARAALGAFLGADPDDLAAVPNATTGVSTVLRSLALAPGDELLATDHGYGACQNALDFVAGAAGARVVVARVPFPLASADEVVEAVLAAVTPRTRLALLDHVTSPTGLVFPIARLVRALAERGVETLVDAAHAPGMLEVALDATGAAYTVGNLHKWVCAPKGAAFLHVRRDRQADVRPLAISHGATQPLEGATRFRREFDWTGTADPTPFLCVPAAIEHLGGLLPGGWPALRAANHALVVEARRLLCAALDAAPPAPEAMLGSLAAVPLPDAPPGTRLDPRTWTTPLQDALLERHRLEVPIPLWPPRTGRRLVRVSAQAYNHPAQYERLGRALRTLLDEEARGPCSADAGRI